ncbi:MAG: hypothetical protein FJ276_08310 [Planctomycetes bacterium]|nr:hypothetical protein [Planctomycetota bacterium]
MTQAFARDSDGYRVPKQFSMAETLAMITVFGFLFGVLRQFEAPATLYMFLGTQAVLICLVQMRYGTVPRGASTLVGCVFMPLWVWVLNAFDSRHAFASFGQSVFDLPITVLFGGLLGYCTGALAAGVFLVMDVVGRAAARRTRARHR